MRWREPEGPRPSGGMTLFASDTSPGSARIVIGQIFEVNRHRRVIALVPAHFCTRRVDRAARPPVGLLAGVARRFARPASSPDRYMRELLRKLHPIRAVSIMACTLAITLT